MCRGKTCQSAPDVAAHSLGQVEAYFTVREILAKASTGADGVHWCEHSDFYRYIFATLGLSRRIFLCQFLEPGEFIECLKRCETLELQVLQMVAKLALRILEKR